MSAAAVAEAVEVPKKKGPKKLVLILAAVVLLLVIAGGAAVYLLKKKAAAAAEGEEGDAAAQVEEAPSKRADGAPPAFLPLDPFVVNLSDRDSERYAQVGVTLQVEDAKVAEQLKLYMPAIRNGVLMILAHKSSAELLEREGKERLAAEIMREAVRPLGIELPPVEPPAADGEPAPKKKRAPAVHNPVEHVHFSSFIIQ